MCIYVFPTSSQDNLRMPGDRRAINSNFSPRSVSNPMPRPMVNGVDWQYSHKWPGSAPTFCSAFPSTCTSTNRRYIILGFGLTRLMYKEIRTHRAPCICISPPLWKRICKPRQDRLMRMALMTLRRFGTSHTYLALWLSILSSISHWQSMHA